MENFSLISSSDYGDLFNEKYNFNIDKKNIAINIRKKYLNEFTIGFIFFFDMTNKGTKEYVINQINNDRENNLNEKSIIIAYQDGKDKGEIIIDKKLDDLAYQKGINIFKAHNENDITILVEKLVRLIKFGEGKQGLPLEMNEFNKYIDF